MILKRLSRLRRYCLNFQEIENYEEAVKSPERYDLHHRKEIETLDDGTLLFRSERELKDLDLYYHRPPEELIFLEHSEHMKIPKHSAESRSKMSSAKIGERNTQFGRTGDMSPHWKGNSVSDHAKYLRLRRQKQRAPFQSVILIEDASIAELDRTRWDHC